MLDALLFWMLQHRRSTQTSQRLHDFALRLCIYIRLVKSILDSEVRVRPPQAYECFDEA